MRQTRVGVTTMKGTARASVSDLQKKRNRHQHAKHDNRVPRTLIRELSPEFYKHCKTKYSFGVIFVQLPLSVSERDVFHAT